MPPRKVNPVFIVGTDTNVGKTVVTGLLAKYFTAKGIDVVTQKWVQTGCLAQDDSDIKAHLDIMGVTRDILPQQLPYCFKFPASPHLAARKEGVRVNIEKIKVDFEHLAQNFHSVIAEGTGGVYVPLTENNLILDLAVRLGLPVVLVVANRLGAINHALLTIEHLRVRKLKIIGAVFNSFSEEDPDILEDNPAIVHTVSTVSILGSLPFNKNFTQLYDNFAPIAEKIWVALQR